MIKAQKIRIFGNNFKRVIIRWNKRQRQEDEESKEYENCNETSSLLHTSFHGGTAPLQSMPSYTDFVNVNDEKRNEEAATTVSGTSKTTSTTYTFPASVLQKKVSVCNYNNGDDQRVEYSSSGSSESVAAVVSTQRNVDEEENSMISSKKCEEEKEKEKEDERSMNPLLIACVLSTASAFGCVAATLFLLVLPIECARIGDGEQRSVDLGFFIAIAGLSQLVCPVIGMASDNCGHPWGRRRPFLLLGCALGFVGFTGMRISSARGGWVLYTFSFLVAMFALNVVYSALIALIPDLVPESQTGVANGVFALLIVVGSLLGFACFHYFLHSVVEDMYVFYNGYLCITTLMTLCLAKETPLLAPNEASSLSSSTTIPTGSGRSHMNGARSHGGWCSPILSALNTAAGSIVGVSSDELKGAYWLSPAEHHDFFVVTVSRTFYYMGVSVQTFLMYFLHDIVKAGNPTNAVALLSAVGFASGAVTCYPVGFISDTLCNGQRKPFVYASCAILAAGCIGLACCRSVRQVLALCCVVGGANGAYLTMDTSLAVDTLPTKDDAAKFLGIWGVAGFVGSAMGPMIGGPLLYFFGKSGMVVDPLVEQEKEMDDEYREYSILGYGVVFGMAAMYFAVSAFSLKWVNDRHV